MNKNQNPIHLSLSTIRLHSSSVIMPNGAVNSARTSWAMNGTVGNASYVRTECMITRKAVVADEGKIAWPWTNDTVSFCSSQYLVVQNACLTQTIQNREGLTAILGLCHQSICRLQSLRCNWGISKQRNCPFVQFQWAISILPVSNSAESHLDFSNTQEKILQASLSLMIADLPFLQSIPSCHLNGLAGPSNQTPERRLHHGRTFDGIPSCGAPHCYLHNLR